MPEENETTPAFSKTEGHILLAYARSAVEAAVQGSPAPTMEPGLAATMCVGVFVSLKRGNQLRACLGNLTEDEPGRLGTMIEAAAARAGVADERFPSIHPTELPYLRVEVSVMFDLKTVEGPDSKRPAAIEVGTHGLIISHSRGRGLLLPQVATERGWDAKTFLDQVCLKAKLAPNTWQQPGATLKTFRGEIFESEPEGNLDFEPSELNDSDRNALLAIVKSGFSQQRQEFSVTKALMTPQPSLVGVLLECEDGKNGLAIRKGASMIDLVKLAVKSITRENSKPAPLVRFIILSHSIVLNPKDSAARHASVNRGAIMGKLEEKLSFVLKSKGNSIQTVLKKIGLKPGEWESSDASLTSFSTSEIPLSPTQQGRVGDSTGLSRKIESTEQGRVSDSTESIRKQNVKVVSKAVATAKSRPKPTMKRVVTPPPQEVPEPKPASTPQPERAKTTREAAVAGKFYPKTRNEIQSALDEHFFNVPLEATLQDCRGIMLPHAGWKYCGDIIAETISQAKIPQCVVIISPKHTAHGANWSINGDASWELPQGKIPVDTDAVNFLANAVPNLEIETDAHKEEHGIEVLLPFLLWANPRLKIVPIVIGSSELEELQPLANALAEWRTEVISEEGKAPLFVISSDMNHFADDTENRRLDALALDAMKTGDPNELFQVCTENEISMCGMRPAVAILEALNADKPCEVVVTKYDTSAKVSGDDSRVVGYAGALLTEL